MQPNGSTAQTNFHNWLAENNAEELSSLTANQSFLVWMRKGSPTETQVRLSATANEVIELTDTTAVQTITGTMTSPRIGPALQWQTLEWQTEEVEVNDQQQVTVIGVQNNFETPLLTTSNFSTPLDLSGINAEQYRFLKLRWTTTDTVNFTPPQLDNWRVWLPVHQRRP